MGKTWIVICIAALCGLGLLMTAIGRTSNTHAPEITISRIAAQLEPLRELTVLRVRVSGIVHGRQTGSRFWQGEDRMVLRHWARRPKNAPRRS